MRKSYPFYKNESVDSLVQLVERSCHIYGDSIAIKYKTKKRIYEKSYIELLSDSRKVAQFLFKHNFNKGHIAVLGSSSYDWIISYLGTVFAGLVVVPIDKELPTNAIAELFLQADVDCLLYDEEYFETVTSIINNFHLDISYIPFGEFSSLIIDNISLPAVEPDKLSAILYTSGTTGKSKGVMLTQRNIASNVIQGLGAVNLQHDKDVIMSVLPFNHAYEFTCTILGMIYKGVPICICSGLKYIQKEFLEYKPTLMFIVPLLAEKLYDRIELSVKQKGKEKIFVIAKRMCHILKKINIDLTEIFFKEVKFAFGGKLKVLMCGGAPLSEALIKKYDDIGINLFQGYGLTECSPLLTVNFDYYHRPNSVGKIVEGNSVKVVDGEIWASGISVSKGYYNDPEATKDSFENGWFKTGDLGCVDADGFVFITGRKKNLIILSNGENVSAEELENMIYNISYVSEVIVYGKDEKIYAEIYIEPEHSVEYKILEKEINKINSNLPAYKNIDKIILRDNPFEKTTTKKIKRYNNTEG